MVVKTGSFGYAEGTTDQEVSTMTLGQRIQELRKGLDLSQEELGEKMGISRQAISKWEADQTIPDLDKLIALSRLFGLTIGQLLGVEQPLPPLDIAGGLALTPKLPAAAAPAGGNGDAGAGADSGRSGAGCPSVEHEAPVQHRRSSIHLPQRPRPVSEGGMYLQ